MKRIIFIFLVSISFVAHSQTELQRQTSLEAGIFSLGVNHQQPLSRTIMADISAGYGSSTYSYYSGSLSFAYFDFSPFTRVELKHIYNRQKRLNKGKDISFNRGNFIGLQNKMIFIDKKNLTMINEFHWGVQTELAKKLLMNFHLGIGHYNNVKDSYDKGTFFPSIGFYFRYILF